MKFKKLISIILSLLLSVTMLSSCEEGIELGDIIEEIEYLVGFDTIGGDTQPTDSKEFDEILDDFDFEDDTSNKEEDTQTQDEPPKDEQTEPSKEESPQTIDEYGTFTSKDDVALYIHTYGKLPQNFITKNEARSLGWQGGGLEDYAPGKCIGGDYFGNFEGLLPEKKGREYTECDIDTLGKDSRGAKRIVFSNDGLIYYTDDHYESFTLLYGKEE